MRVCSWRWIMAVSAVRFHLWHNLAQHDPLFQAGA